MTTTMQAPIIRGADEGEKRWFYGGAMLTWKASSTETNGAFSLWEASMLRGKVTPLHTHPADETMYLLEGRSSCIWTVRSTGSRRADLCSHLVECRMRSWCSQT